VSPLFVRHQECKGRRAVCLLFLFFTFPLAGCGGWEESVPDFSLGFCGVLVFDSCRK